MSEASKISLAISPGEFFRTEIQAAAQDQDLVLPQEVEFYLVDLMCKFIHLDPGQDTIGNSFGKPLAIMLNEALEGSEQERIDSMRKIGDTSLYISGFFQDYFNGKAFSIDYYMTIGSGAYKAVADLEKERSRAGARSELYHTMGDSFSKLVETIALVSDKFSPMGHKNLLEIYSRWTSTQSDRLRKKLQESGILPIDVDMKTAQ